MAGKGGRRRKTGRGSVRNVGTRAKPAWLARLQWTGDDGAKDWRQVFSSEEAADAEIKRRRDLLRRDAESVFEKSKRSVAQLFEVYVAEVAKAPVLKTDEARGEVRKVAGLKSWKSVRSYLRTAEAHIGKVPLGSLSAAKLEALRFTLESEPLPSRKTKPEKPDIQPRRGPKRKVRPPKKAALRSHANVNRILAAVRSALSWGVKHQWLERNPFTGAGLINLEKESRRPDEERDLTPKAEKKLLAALASPVRCHLRPLVIALLDTGARKGELQRLTWEDVDFFRRRIRLIASNTKTQRERYLPISARLFIELQKLKRASGGDAAKPVFGVSDPKNAFRSAAREAGLPNLRVHDLRHVFATRLAEALGDPLAVSKLLGHRDVAMTSRYVDSNSRSMDRARTALDARDAKPKARRTSKAIGAADVN